MTGVIYDRHLLPMPAGCPAFFGLISCGCGPEAPLGPQGPTPAHHRPNPDKHHPPPALNCASPPNGLRSKHEGVIPPSFSKGQSTDLTQHPSVWRSRQHPRNKGAPHTLSDAQCAGPDALVWLCSTSVGAGLEPLSAGSRGSPPEPVRPCWEGTEEPAQ